MPAAMERLDHRLELADLLAVVAGAGIAGVRREEIDRVVAPVVVQVLVDEMLVVEEGVNRHQLDRGDAELLQVVDRDLVAEPGVGAAALLGDPGMAGGESLYMQFVDDRAVERRLRRSVVSPIEVVIDHDALREPSGVLLVVAGQIGVLLAGERVAEHRRGPIDLPGERLGVRIDQQLGLG